MLTYLTKRQLLLPGSYEMIFSAYSKPLNENH